MAAFKTSRAFVSGVHRTRSQSPPILRVSASSTTAHAHRDNDNQPPQEQHLVLIGGGHAHVQVIKAFNSVARPSHLKVTLIDALQSASYSGMIPGCVANLYTPEQSLIHLRPLAEWAGLDFVHDRVVDIDFDQKLVFCQNQRDPISFDAMSIDIGSTSRGLDETPGAKRYSIPTRPIGQLVKRLNSARQEILDQTRDKTGSNGNADAVNRPKVVVIGAGAAGIELSMAITSCWEESGLEPEITLLDAGEALMPDENDAARNQLEKVVDTKNIQIKHNVIVKEIQENYIALDSSSSANGASETLVPYTYCIWATGAGSHPLAQHLSRQRGLATTERGWIQVGPTLQSKSHPFIFAAGDCAAIQDLPNGSPPKAGVFAVRTGPILIENLTHYLSSLNTNNNMNGNGDYSPSALIEYQPQDDYMKLLVCGDGKALGFRFGLALYGKWVFEMKDAIDQHFMSLFQVDPNIPPTSYYNNAQYDDDQDEKNKIQSRTPKDARVAAELLQRQDDSVDYEIAWAILRTMAANKEYQQQVLSYITPTGMDVPSSTKQPIASIKR